MRTCAVIIAAYNAAKHIEQCVRSVETQEPLRGWTYELRVGVDGCARTAAALQRTGRHFLYSKENRGTYIMANSLIAQGPADVYARFDADDRMLPDYLATVIPVALDWGICHAPHVSGGNRKGYYNAFSKPRVGQVTFTAEVLEKVGGFFNARVHSDRDFTRRAELAGCDIKGMRADPRLKRGLFLRTPSVNSLTRSAMYGYNSQYRREVRNLMASLRTKGKIKIKPETVKLSERGIKVG